MQLLNGSCRRQLCQLLCLLCLDCCQACSRLFQCCFRAAAGCLDGFFGAGLHVCNSRSIAAADLSNGCLCTTAHLGNSCVSAAADLSNGCLCAAAGLSKCCCSAAVGCINGRLKAAAHLCNGCISAAADSLNGSFQTAAHLCNGCGIAASLLSRCRCTSLSFLHSCWGHQAAQLFRLLAGSCLQLGNSRLQLCCTPRQVGASKLLQLRPSLRLTPLKHPQVSGQLECLLSGGGAAFLCLGRDSLHARLQGGGSHGRLRWRDAGAGEGRVGINASSLQTKRPLATPTPPAKLSCTPSTVNQTQS